MPPRSSSESQPSASLCPIPRAGVQGAAGILLHLMLLLAAATVGIGICAMRTTSETEVMIAEGISLAALILLLICLWRVTHTSKGIVPVLVTAAAFLAYLSNSMIPAAVLVGLLFAVGVGAFIASVQPVNRLWLLLPVALAAYAAAAALSRDPVGAVAAFIPFPAILVLAWGTRQSAEREDGLTRVGVICATSLTLGLSLGAMIALSLYRHLGSLELTVLGEALEGFRASIIEEITSTEIPTEGLSEEALAEMKEILSHANVSNAVNSLFNLLPAISVVIVNILAATTQLIQHAALRSFGFEASLTDRVKVFRMSLISCVVFLVAYLVAIFEDSMVSTLAGTVAQNIYIILLPGLALAGMLRITGALTRKGPRNLGCLFFMILLLIPCLLVFSPFLLAAVEVIGHIFQSVTSALKPPEDPDDPFGDPPEFP